jgi:hypothetical protein
MTRLRFCVILAAACLLPTITSCATGQTSSSESASTSATSTDTQDQPPAVPTPEELEGSPCGNPEWAKLPAGHEQSGDDGDTSPADDSSEDDADSTNHSDRNNDAKQSSNQTQFNCQPAG